MLPGLVLADNIFEVALPNIFTRLDVLDNNNIKEKQTMRNLISTTLSISALTLCLTSTANAQLETRLGGLALYDDDLDITWLSDANLIASNSFGLSYDTELGDHPSTTFIETQNTISSSGRSTWGGAMHWIDAMNASDVGAGHLGFNDWRLPMTLIPDSSCSAAGNNCTGSEMGHLYNIELGGLAGITASGGQPFTNLNFTYYWSSLEDANDPSRVWRFDFGFGGVQAALNKNPGGFFAFAVRDGDVSSVSVPEPGALGLVALGLMGLVTGRRKYRE